MTDTVDRVALAERAATAGSEVALETFRTDIDVETKDGKTDVVTQADRDAQRRVVRTIREAYADAVEYAIVGEESVAQRATDEASGSRRERSEGVGEASSEGRSPSDQSSEERSDPRAADERKRVPEEGDAWIIDPIDGTNNYVRDIPIWATSVAAVRDGDAVAAANVLPALGDAYVAGPDGVECNGEPISVSDRTDPETFTVAPTIWWEFDRRDEYAEILRGIVERFGDMRRFGCAQATLAMVASGALEATVTNVPANPWDTVAGAYMVELAGGTVTDVHGDPWRHDSEGLVASNGEAHEEVLAVVRNVNADEA